MLNKKIFAIILSAVILSAAVSIGAYKIFSKGTPSSTAVDPKVNFQSIVDSIDYTENLLDSNQVYKEKFQNDLSSQGKWIPVKQKDFIRELTTPADQQSDTPEIQNVSNENTSPTNLANDKAPADDDESFTEEVSTTNLTSADIQPVNKVTETKTIEKIVYIWQPNECNESSWNPYTNGHWEFTCAGWVWASDYRWGSHCYNYGRWVWTSFYGWVWMPGDRWAPNWVTWRYCANYNGGSYCSWYPTCPVVYWQNQHHMIVCNNHFTSNPVHWTVVSSTNLTKYIGNGTKIDPKKNIEILNNSTKIKATNILATNDSKIKYNGPNVIDISKVTNTKITPKVIDIPTKFEGTSAGTNENGTKNTNGPKNPVKVTPVKQTKYIDPVKVIDNITKSNVSNHINNNETNQSQINQSPIKQPTTKTTQTPPIKVAGPSVNPPIKEGTKTDPAKNLPPTKTTTTKTETPKQEPPVKTNPPVKNDPPKYDPPVKNDPPKYDPPKYDPPKYDPPKYDPPVKNDPPPVKQDPPKQDPPTKQDPPKQDPPKKEDGKKND